MEERRKARWRYRAYLSRLRWGRVIAIAITLQIHLAAAIWLTRPASPQASPPFVETPETVTMQVRLHSAAPPVTPKPVARIAAPAVERHRHVRATARSRVTAVIAGVRAPGDRPMLYAPDGAILLPAAAVVVTGRDPDQVDMRHFQQLPCRGTRFSSRYARAQDESLGNEVARKYLSWIGLYNAHSEEAYRKRRAWHDRACAP